MDKGLLRSIPPVDELLDSPALEELASEYPNLNLTPLVRRVLDDFRAGNLGTTKPDRDSVKSLIVDAVAARVRELRSGGMKRLINATGVILHTNLGRAVLGESVMAAINDAANYTNLEIDLDSGKRSRRADVLESLLCTATGAEAAMVVNNNAAAVYLVVGAFCPPGRVLVSRGELVEIGGSFRLPDILHQAAGEVIELGTTNRTYAKDYANAVREGDLILRAHRSNYDIKGFTHEASLADLVEVGRKAKATVVYDLGSGSFFDYAGLGVGGEETVSEVLASGVDGVTMSGDKLLGGVQAGIILGSRKFLASLKQNPLRRAVRIDKLTIAALQALLRDYLFYTAPERRVPVLRQTGVSSDELQARAESIVAGLGAVAAAFTVAVADDEAAVGGGSFADAQLASIAIAIRCRDDRSAEELARRLREQDVPIMTRIKASEVRLNLRSVLPSEDETVQAGLAAALK